MDDKFLLNQQEAATYLGTTVGTLNSWRFYGNKQKIPYVRWGNRIRYRREDLDAWIAKHLETGEIVAGHLLTTKSAQPLLTRARTWRQRWVGL